MESKLEPKTGATANPRTQNRVTRQSNILRQRPGTVQRNEVAELGMRSCFARRPDPDPANSCQIWGQQGQQGLPGNLGFEIFVSWPTAARLYPLLGASPLLYEVLEQIFALLEIQDN